MANFRLLMISIPSVMRTYYTTFCYEMMLDALKAGGIDFKEGEKGRIFFRMPNYPQTLVELCRGGALMLKGAFSFDLQDDHLIADLFKIQTKDIPPPMILAYKLSSFHASRRWLKVALSECFDILTEERHNPYDQHGCAAVFRNAWPLLRRKATFRRNRPKSEMEQIRQRRFWEYLNLLLTGQKETAFTPFSFYDAFYCGKLHMVMLDPEMNRHITLNGGRNITYMFHMRYGKEWEPMKETSS